HKPEAILDSESFLSDSTERPAFNEDFRGSNDRVVPVGESPSWDLMTLDATPPANAAFPEDRLEAANIAQEQTVEERLEEFLHVLQVETEVTSEDHRADVLSLEETSLAAAWDVPALCDPAAAAEPPPGPVSPAEQEERSTPAGATIPEVSAACEDVH